MKPATWNIIAYENRDFAQVFTFDYEITDITFLASYESGSTKNSFTITKLNANDLQISLSAAQVGALTKNNWTWDLKQVSNGFSTQVIEGTLQIKNTVTL